MTTRRKEPSRSSTETQKDNINWLAKQLAPFVPLPPVHALLFPYHLASRACKSHTPFCRLLCCRVSSMHCAGLAFFFPSLQKKCEMQQNKPSISHKYIKQSSPSQRTGCLLPQV